MAWSTGGSHYFEAIAYDKVGNISEKAKYDWVIDLQPPVVEFTKTPANYIAETMTEFAFKANDNISSRFNYYCKGNAGSYQLCGNPYTIKDLKEGGQTFSVRAEDEAGNLSQPIAHTWNVDLTPPDIVFVKKPIDHKNDRTSVFNLNIEDKLSGFEKAWCGLKGHLQECAKNQKLEYKIEQPGLYEFEVVAMDKVGNKSSLSHTWQIFDKYKSINQLVEINAQSFDVDILFVVDNSDSMAEEQRNMADRIDNFISKIEDLNWHIAVTSTDPREEAPIGNCDIGLEQFCEHEKLEHGDGGFVKFGNNQRILTPDVLQAQKLLGNAIQLGTGGSSSEEGIRATYRVIEKSQSSTNPSHQQFFRANAALAVILISDEDESDNEFKNKPHNLFQLVKDNWPQKSFKFHSMINLKQFNCINNDLGFGKEYEKMSHLTEGIIGSVCQDNYSEDLSSIGSEVRKQVSFVDLKCLPQDKNNDGTPDLEVELEDGQSVPSFKIEGLKVIFDNPLPAGKHVLKYVCLI